MKRKLKIFFRAFYLTSVIILCISIGAFGIAKAYENTLKTGFGEYRKAIELDDEKIRILDFEIEI